MYLHFSDILICHFHQSSSSDVLSEVSLRHFHQSALYVAFCHCILSLYYVTLFCHLFSHLPTSLYCVVCFCHVPLSFSSVIFTWHSESVIYRLFLSLHSVISCVILLSCASVIIIWQSRRPFAIYNQCVDFFCQFALSCSSVVSLCPFFGNAPLPLSSATLFCRVSVSFFWRPHVSF